MVRARHIPYSKATVRTTAEFHQEQLSQKSVIQIFKELEEKKNTYNSVSSKNIIQTQMQSKDLFRQKKKNAEKIYY